jgi:hypothetical protein
VQRRVIHSRRPRYRFGDQFNACFFAGLQRNLYLGRGSRRDNHQLLSSDSSTTGFGQVLYGEAHGQTARYGNDDPTELAIGAVIRNRLNDSHFANSSTYQGLITPGQFDGISTNITTGISPELQNAALLFGGGSATPTQLAAMNVGNAACFFSPDAAGWAAIQNALNDPRITVVPRVAKDPRCFTFKSYANEQIVYKRSISKNTDGSGAPAFVFEQEKAVNEPAVIAIPD